MHWPVVVEHDLGLLTASRLRPADLASGGVRITAGGSEMCPPSYNLIIKMMISGLRPSMGLPTASWLPSAEPSRAGSSTSGRWF